MDLCLGLSVSVNWIYYLHNFMGRHYEHRRGLSSLNFTNPPLEGNGNQFQMWGVRVMKTEFT